MRVADLWVEVEGGRIFVRCWTPDVQSELPPVLLLHDSLGSVQLWRDFPERLAECLGTQVIAYDRLGFGASTVLNGSISYSFIEDEGTRYLRRILEKMSITRYFLFGHSVGGSMAIHAAEQDAGRCLAVVSESAQAFVEARTREGIHAAQIQFAKPDGFARLARYHGERTEWVLNAWFEPWLSKEFDHWSLEEVLKAGRTPLLVIHGSEDEFGSLAFPHAMAEWGAGHVEIQILQGTGHVPHRTDSVAVLSRVKLFFEKNARLA